MSKILSTEIIKEKIFVIRGHKVMIDKDLSELYGVSTKVLNQAVKRNKQRFPIDFMFQLSKQEKQEVVTNCDHLNSLKYSPQCPHVFTEQGVAMLSSVLNSERAVQVNIAIMRTFVQIREILSVHKELAQKLKDLERKVTKHDAEIENIFKVIRQLMTPQEKLKKPIGFSAS